MKVPRSFPYFLKYFSILKRQKRILYNKVEFLLSIGRLLLRVTITNYSFVWAFIYISGLELTLISSPLLTKKQAHRRFGRGGIELLLIEEQFSTNYGSELGKIMLDTTFEERDLLNEKTVPGDIIAPDGVRVAVAFKMVFVYIDSGFDILIIVPCRTRRGVLIAVKSQKRGIPS
ncbi:hypothetical protein YC2023_016740 [Brassica napus]